MNVKITVVVRREPRRDSFRFMHDIEMGALRDATPCPEVFVLGTAEENTYSHRVPLNKAWQIFAFELFVWSAYRRRVIELTTDEKAYMVQKWSSLMGNNRAFTNGSGSGLLHNYIDGSNANQPDMAYDKVRVTGGATVSGIETTNVRGDHVIQVVTFDGSQPPPPVESVNPLNDRRVFWATYVYTPTNVGPFPQLDGTGAPTPLIGHDVPVPIVALQPVYYPRTKVVKIAPGSLIPPPYIDASVMYNPREGISYERRMITSPRSVVAHIVRVDLTKTKRIFVTPKPTKATTPTEWIEQYHPTILINGDEHTYPGGGFVPLVKGKAMSNGVSYSDATTETTFSFGQSDYRHRALAQWGYPSWAYNAVSGSHELVRSSAVLPGLDNVALDPRSMIGMASDGQFLLVATEGRMPNNLGLSMKESADLMSSLGAVSALNLDGGKDTMLWIEGMGFVNQLTQGEQAIANALLLWL